MPKPKKQKPPVNPNTPACPVCGRRSSVRRISEGMHYCDHCHEAFTA